MFAMITFLTVTRYAQKASQLKCFPYVIEHVWMGFIFCQGIYITRFSYDFRSLQDRLVNAWFD